MGNRNQQMALADLSRRDWLKQSAAVVAGGSLWQAVPRRADAAGAASEQEPLFRFVQINDLHVQAALPSGGENERQRTYARANEKCSWCVKAINEGPKTDFVLGVGDLVHGGSLERLEPDFDELSKLIEPLKPTLYPTIGNHEVVQAEGDPTFERAYREMFGDDRVSYTFEHGGLMFVMLNNSGATSVRKEVIAARNEWLRKVLETNVGKEKVICCHIPIAPVRDDAVLAKSFGFPSWHAHDDELLGLVDSHAESILAVLSGHLHLTGYTMRKGVPHISICGTASYPSDFARFAVFGDRLEMTVCQLPEELNSAAPSLHGQPRHPQDFTDSTHATAKEYEIGRSDERQLTIRRKRLA